MPDFKSMDYYQRLGVSRHATTEEIKSAYTEVARIFHPDSHFYDDLLDEVQKEARPEHEEALRYITEGYTTLINEAKRAAYDRTLPPEIGDWSESPQPKDEIKVRMKEKEIIKEKKPTCHFGEFEQVEIISEAAKGPDAPVKIQSVAEMIRQQREQTKVQSMPFSIKLSVSPAMVVAFGGALLLLGSVLLLVILKH